MGHTELFSTDSSNLAEFSTVYVNSLNVFPDPVAGKITLAANTTYIWTKPVNTGTIEFIIPTNGNITFTSTNAVANNWLTQIGAGQTLLSGDISRIFIDGLEIISFGSGKCFDLSTGTAVGPHLFLENSRIVGFDKIGNLDGIALLTKTVAYILNGDGWSLNDMSFITIEDQLYVLQSGDHITMTGNLSDFGFIREIVATPSDGDAVLNLDSALNIRRSLQISMSVFMPVPGLTFFNSNGIESTGGTFFKPGGLDGTDPKIRVFTVEQVIDSNWVGSLGFKENTTITTVLLDTYTDIVGTMVAGIENERFTTLVDTLTYTGKEDIKTRIEVSISASRTVPASSGRTIRAAVFIDSGLGFIEKTDSLSMTIKGDVASFSFRTKPIILLTNDKIKVQIKNEDTIDSILIIDYNLTVEKL